MRRLARDADVFVESFRPGVADRLGLDHGALRAVNPRLIDRSISAYGQRGPLAPRPGLDPVVQCYGGLAWEQGAPDLPAAADAPTLVRGSLVDYYTGSLAASGILLALLARGADGRRPARGDLPARRRPRHAGGPALLGGGRRAARGRPGPAGRPGLPHLSHADGHRDPYVELPRFWDGLCRTLGLEAWLEDPRLATMTGRHAHKAELIARITQRLAAATAAEWEARFVAADVPCTRIRAMAELLVDPQAAANGTVAGVHHPALGPVRFLGVPVRLDATPGQAPGPPPELGADGDTVLRQAGYSAREVAGFRAAGAVL